MNYIKTDDFVDNKVTSKLLPDMEQYNIRKGFEIYKDRYKGE